MLYMTVSWLRFVCRPRILVWPSISVDSDGFHRCFAKSITNSVSSAAAGVHMDAYIYYGLSFNVPAGVPPEEQTRRRREIDF